MSSEVFGRDRRIWKSFLVWSQVVQALECWVEYRIGSATFGSGSRYYQALGGTDMRNCGLGRSVVESFAGLEI